jgi:hypothetical protein
MDSNFQRRCCCLPKYFKEGGKFSYQLEQDRLAGLECKNYFWGNVDTIAQLFDKILFHHPSI